MMKKEDQSELSRRGFLHDMSATGAFIGMSSFAAADDKPPTDADDEVIPGFEKGEEDPNASKGVAIGIGSQS